ncbi:hypothetical protein [Corallococcus exercitus]|uniref:hypothetical protein n=1 Tax=Corallococcus exercitus TaxID=2316736 RepID=UPI001FC9AE24|nr:hypothetical protein [Corallococcus exercitus]
MKSANGSSRSSPARFVGDGSGAVGRRAAMPGDDVGGSNGIVAPPVSTSMSTSTSPQVFTGVFTAGAPGA